MVRMVFKQANALFVFLCALPVALSIQWERVECCDWCVFVCVCTFRDTPSPKLGKSFSLCVCVSVSLLHSVIHFPSLALFFPFLLPLLMSACFLLLLSSPLSSHRGRMHSCQEGRRCLWSGLDKDQASLPCYPPSCSPSPPPWENGCTLLPGRAPAPLWVCCQPWQQRLNMICLSAAACLHQTLAPTPITPAGDPEVWLAGTDLEWGSWKGGRGG